MTVINKKLLNISEYNYSFVACFCW